MKIQLSRYLWIALAFPLSASAGSYMRSGGEGFTSLGLSMDLGDRLFDKNGHTRSGNCSPGQSAYAYGEYGWSYYTTVFVGGSIRNQACDGGEKPGLEGGKVGISRRINPTSNALIWEVALLLPSRQIGAQSSSRDTTGVAVGLHYHPRVNPYDLGTAINPLQPNWDFGIDLQTWFGEYPNEASVYAQYTFPLQATDWNLGQGGWAGSFRLQYKQSMGSTQITTPNAIDSRDAFRRLDASLSFRHALTPSSALGIGLQTSLAGKNIDDSSSITLSYEKTFAK